MTAKLQQVTQLLSTLKKDLQEKHLSPAREFEDEYVARYSFLIFDGHCRKSPDTSAAAPVWHESRRRRTDLLQRCMMSNHHRPYLSPINTRGPDICHRESGYWRGMESMERQPMCDVPPCAALPMLSFSIPACARSSRTRDTEANLRKD